MGKKKKSTKAEKLIDNAEPDIGENKSEEKVQENASGDITKRPSSRTSRTSKIESTVRSTLMEPRTSKVVVPEGDERLNSIDKRASSLKSRERVSRVSRTSEGEQVTTIYDDKHKLRRLASSRVAFTEEKKETKTKGKNERSKRGSTASENETAENQPGERKKKKDKKQKKGQKKDSEGPVDKEPKEGKDETKKGKKKQKKPAAEEVPSVPSVTRRPLKMEASSKSKLSEAEFSSKTELTHKISSKMEMKSSQLLSHSTILTSKTKLEGESSTMFHKRNTRRSKKSLTGSSRKLTKSSEKGFDLKADSSDEYSYSSASSEEIEEEKKKKKTGKGRSKTKAVRRTSVKPVDEEEKIKGGKKGKKGKKKKSDVTFEEVPEEPLPEEDDVMAEIHRMKISSMVQTREIAEPTEIPPAPESPMKKGPKKKVSKKEKARMTAELAEKMRLEAEQEAARLAELERIRLEKERREAMEKEKREIAEQQIREEQLHKSVAFMKEVSDYAGKISEIERENKEWQLYVECRRLPNPSLSIQMNTYLHLWEQVIENTTMVEAAQRTKDVLELLTDLEDLIDNSRNEVDSKKLIWKWVRQLFRDHQKASLDVATYRLLRCVEKNLNRIDIPTADFNYNDDNITLTLWLRVQLPIPLPNPRRPPRPRVDVSFAALGMQVLLPSSLDCENMALRGMYLKYDHLSDSCNTYYMPQEPPYYLLDLQDATKKEWRLRLKYKYDYRDKKEKSPEPLDAAISDHSVGKKEEEAKAIEEAEPEDFASDEEIPFVPYKKLEPTSSEFAISAEDKLYLESRKNFTIKQPEHILNLRKYTILGGVYHLDLLYQPPQPQDFVTIDMTITSLYLPKKLEHVPFSVTYTPPAPPEPGIRRQPEELEEEMKRLEEEMDKLILVTLTWPQHVIFLELPLVCQWVEDEKQWSREHVHDLKHNEEKGTLTFRTGIFGIFGLAAVRYANLPYQAWEIRPEADDSITVNVTAAILILEFNVKNGLICISQLQNSPNNALQDVIRIYFKLHKLKRIMREAGIDLFPEPDAFCYVTGSCEKQWPMERHLYYNMARLSNSFNFAWSRWNLSAGRRNIVLQMREFFPNKQKQKNHSMLLVTPLKSMFIDCTEVSQVFSDEGVDTQKFSADLFNLMKATSGIAVRKKVQAASKENVYALSELLTAVRFLSFS